MMKFVVLFCLLAVTFAKPGMKGKWRHMEKFQEICSTYSNVELCEAARGRCTSAMKRGMHKAMKDQSFKQEKKDNFKECVQESGLDRQFQQFQDNMKDKMQGMKMNKMRPKPSGGAPRGFLQTDDSQGDAYERSEDRYDFNSDDGQEYSTSGRNHHNEGGDSNEDDRHHGEYKHKAKEFLKTLSDGLGKELRCCMLTKSGKMVNGQLSKTQIKTKIAEKVIADPTVLEGFNQGIDSCQAPTDCDLMDFKECTLKSCIDRVLEDIKN